MVGLRAMIFPTRELFPSRRRKPVVTPSKNFTVTRIWNLAPRQAARAFLVRHKIRFRQIKKSAHVIITFESATNFKAGFAGKILKLIQR